jgi:hypothetical protein
LSAAISEPNLEVFDVACGDNFTEPPHSQLLIFSAINAIFYDIILLTTFINRVTVATIAEWDIMLLSKQQQRNGGSEG